MKLLGIKVLYEFMEKHADSRSHLESWKAEVEESQWKSPFDIKCRYPKASLIGNQQIVFDICRNKYRLLVLVNFKSSIVLVKRIGTHKEYDSWDIE